METTSQTKIQVTIDPNKPAKDLIKFYFEKINKPELYGDSSIRFIINAKLIPHDSNNLIKSYLNSKIDINTIVVADDDDKIKSFPDS